MHKKKILGTIILIILLNIGCIVYFYNQKTCYHEDEIFSYGHANSSQGAFLVSGIDSNFRHEDLIKYLANRWWTGSVFHDYLTVQSEEKFKYNHVFENLSADVHPPLFYILLHTICSLTPDVFSKWQGAALNIPIWIVLLIMMYKLSKRFFDDRYLAVLPVIFYAYSQIGFNTVLYIRGYLLQTLWAVCLIYEAIILLQEKEINKKHWFLMFLFSFLGMFTQYNSIIYSAIVGLSVGFGLLLQKRYKDIMLLALTLILSVGALIIIFPETIDVFTHTQRAKSVVSNGRNIIISMKNILYEGNKHLSNIYMTALWSFHKTYGLILSEISILILFYKYIYTKSRKDIDLLFLIYIVICLFVEIFMPQMYIYNMRYVMLIMPQIAIVTIWYISFMLTSFNIKDKLIKIIISLIVLINALFVDFSHRSPFAFQVDNSLESIIKDKRVIWTVNIFGNFYLSRKAKEVFYMHPENIAEQKLLEELDKSDYFANFNPNIKYEYYIDKEFKEPVTLEGKYRDKLEYIYSTRVGLWFYDIYKVKKKASNKKEE